MMVLILLLLTTGNLQFLTAANPDIYCDATEKVEVKEYTYNREDQSIDCSNGTGTPGHLTGIGFTVDPKDTVEVTFDDANGIKLCRKKTEKTCCNENDFVKFEGKKDWTVRYKSAFDSWTYSEKILREDLYELLECSDGNEKLGYNSNLTCGENGHWKWNGLEWSGNVMVYNLCTCEEGYERKLVDGKSECVRVCDSEEGYERQTVDGECVRVCERGRVLEGNKCTYCPAGHTTYPMKPNECWGPQLYGYAGKKHDAPEIVSYKVFQPLGEMTVSSPSYWASRGYWQLTPENGGVKKVHEKYTLGNYVHRFKKVKDVTKVVPIVKNIFCWSKGENYVGYRTESVCGRPCIHKDGSNVQKCRKIVNDDVEGWVCYCSNNSNMTEEPSCWTDEGEQPCGIPKCRDDRDPVRDCFDDTIEVGFIEGGLGYTAVYDNITTAKGICERLGRECQGVWVDELDVKLSDKKPEPEDGGERDMYIKSEECSNYHEYYFTQEQPDTSKCTKKKSI